MSSPSSSKTLDNFLAPPLETSYNSPPLQLLTSLEEPAVAPAPTTEAPPAPPTTTPTPTTAVPTMAPVPAPTTAPPPPAPTTMATPLAPTTAAAPLAPKAASPSPASPSLASPPTPTPTRLTAEKLSGMIVGIGIGIVLVVVVGIFIYKKRKWKRVQERLRMENNNGQSHAPPQDSSTNSIAFDLSQSTFSYEELQRATNGFSNVNLIGEGGFGKVYKGVLPDGKEVAIKQLKLGSEQGEREFRAEVEVISHVHHRHLVSLVGYCISGAQRILVYDFVPNNNLDFHLHGRDRPTMTWPTRMKIALCSAKGLAYLHEDCRPKIIHRDIKATNILLDYNFEAKVADFGLAKFLLETETHVTTRIMGTFGYLAPEYAASGKLTNKSDIFSFGVVLLELITGHRPNDKTQSFTNDSMVDWARPLLEEALENGKFDGLVDPSLQNDYNSSEMTRMVACAAACVRHSARHRPRMSQIILALKGNISLDDLDEGIPPGQSRQYKEDKKKFREIQEKSTNHEYSGPSSESGLHPSASSSEGQQTTQEMEFQKTKNE